MKWVVAVAVTGSINANAARTLIDRLMLKSDVSWTSVPDWARFYYMLGATTSCISGDRRIVAGVTVPTRAFAASFTMLGIAAIRAFEQHVLDPIAYFEELCRLPEGTPVAIHRSDFSSKQAGLVGGLVVEGDARYLRVQTSDPKNPKKLNQRSLLPPLQSPRIEILPNENGKRSTFGKRRVTDVPSVLPLLIPPVDAYHYANRTNVDTLVIGRTHLLRNDLGLPISMEDPTTRQIHGTLQDVVRLRENDRFTYRALGLSPGHRKMGMYRRMLRPSIIVFDGASSFIRARHFWQAAHWIVLLDQTDAQFQDATDALNEHYLDRSNEQASRIRGIPNPPPGVELCLFER